MPSSRRISSRRKLSGQPPAEIVFSLQASNSGIEIETVVPETQLDPIAEECDNNDGEDANIDEAFDSPVGDLNDPIQMVEDSAFISSSPAAVDEEVVVMVSMDTVSSFIESQVDKNIDISSSSPSQKATMAKAAIPTNVADTMESAAPPLVVMDDPAAATHDVEVQIIPPAELRACSSQAAMENLVVSHTVVANLDGIAPVKNVQSSVATHSVGVHPQLTPEIGKKLMDLILAMVAPAQVQSSHIPAPVVAANMVMDSSSPAMVALGIQNCPLPISEHGKSLLDKNLDVNLVQSNIQMAMAKFDIPSSKMAAMVKPAIPTSGVAKLDSAPPTVANKLVLDISTPAMAAPANEKIVESSLVLQPVATHDVEVQNSPQQNSEHGPYFEELDWNGSGV